MFFLHKKKELETKVFNLADFTVLNYEELLKVNGASRGSGGSSGGGGGSSSSSSSSGNLTNQGYPSSTSGYGNNGYTSSSSGNLTNQGYPSSTGGYGNNGYTSSSSGNLTNQGYPSSTGGYGNNGYTPSNSPKPSTPSTPAYQIPTDENDVHCDIIAYNQAVDNNVQNPGTWNGNQLTVNQIYNDYYNEQGTTTPQSNTQGYVFYDFDNNGSYDHVEFYQAGAGSNYTVQQTNGIQNPTPVTYNSNVDSNGSAGTGSAIFVPLN